jgi:hypothetical protein
VVLGTGTGRLEGHGLSLAWPDGNDGTLCGGNKVGMGASDPCLLVGGLGEACGTIGASAIVGDNVGTSTSL